MTSYTTPQEWLDYPSDLSSADLVIEASGPGSSAAQTAELTRLIARASSVVDQWTYQPLYAHTRTDTRPLVPDSGSQRLAFRCQDFPVRSLVSARWMGSINAGWNPLADPAVVILGDLDVGHQIVFASGPWLGYGSWGAPPVILQTTYVAGYPNAALSAAVSAGATTLPVDTTVGMAVGDGYTLYDSAATETVTVASVGTSSVTITTGLVNAHAAGIRLGNLPEAVTLATIWLVNAMVKTRRAGGGITMAGKLQPSGLDSQEWKDARAILQPFRRVV